MSESTYRLDTISSCRPRRELQVATALGDLRFKHNYKHLTYPQFRQDSNRLARLPVPKYKYEWEEVNALGVVPAQTVGHRQLRVFAESIFVVSITGKYL
jgi:hypothetical protein